MEKSVQTWNGEKGFIDSSMLQRHLPSLNGPIFYVAGPPAMVTAMRAMLEKAQIDPDDIRAEEFGGY
jgi:ferredoxin-NADP reductase